MRSTIGLELFPTKYEKEVKIATVEGYWTQCVCFDGKKYWDTKEPCYQWLMTSDVLPSDQRFREDLLWLGYGNKQLSQEWKTLLEGHFR